MGPKTLLSISRSTIAAPIPPPLSRRTLGRPAISTGGRFGSMPATWHLEMASPAAQSQVAFSSRGTLRFQWSVPEDIDVIGPMALRLWIKAQDASDLVLFAGIRKFRAGAEVTFEGSYGFSGDMVSKGWQRAAHREIDDHLSIPAQPVHTHVRAEPLAEVRLLGSTLPYGSTRRAFSKATFCSWTCAATGTSHESALRPVPGLLCAQSQGQLGSPERRRIRFPFALRQPCDIGDRRASGTTWVIRRKSAGCFAA